MTPSQAIKNYKKSCNDIVKSFAKKQGLVFQDWLVDELAGVALFESEHCFHLLDIIHDLKTKQKKGFILEWSDYAIEAHTSKSDGVVAEYDEYCMMAEIATGKIKYGKMFSSNNLDEIRKHITEL